jgi:threonine dehydratase
LCDCLGAGVARENIISGRRGRAGPGLTVTDAEVRAAMRLAFARLRLVVEPGAAAALAAVLAGKVAVAAGTVIMLTGGNVDPAAFARIIASED